MINLQVYAPEHIYTYIHISDLPTVQGFPVQYRDFAHFGCSVQAYRDLVHLYRDFGQCTGENGSSVQGYYSNRLAGMTYTLIAF